MGEGVVRSGTWMCFWGLSLVEALCQGGFFLGMVGYSIHGQRLVVLVLCA